VPDDADFDAFVARTMPRLLATAVVYCGHPQNAEDAVQEAYIQAYRHWAEIDSPEAWVRTTMRRMLSRDGRRWWFRWRPVEPRLPGPAASPEDSAYAREVLRAAATLPPRQRQVLVMFCVQDRPYREIAAELGIAEGTVAATLAKARAKLATLLGLTGDGADGGDTLVAAGLGRPRTAARTDRVALALRFTQDRLVRAYAADGATLARVRARIRAAAGRPG
jgi:RNA polymerase sigma factor (sigma-70 family)